MIIPLLALLLQTQGQASKATPADSAFVLTMLDSAAASVPALAQNRNQDLARLLIEQLQTWRGDDAAWRAAQRFDGAGRAGEHYFRMDVIVRAMREGKRDKVRTYLLTFQPEVRNKIIASLPNYMGNVPPDMAPLLDSLATTTRTRAESMYRRAVGFRYNRNTPAARDTLRRAIEILREAGQDYPLEWAVELLHLGEHVPVTQLIRLGNEEAGDTTRAATVHGIDRVRNRLFNLDGKYVAHIADTLLKHLPRDTTFYAGSVRAELLRKRNAPGDSAAASALMDALRMKYQPRVEPGFERTDYALHDLLNQAARNGDASMLDRALIRWQSTGKTATALRMAVSGVWQRSPYRPNAPMAPADREWAVTAFSRIWAASASLEAQSRDSVRLELIRVLARLDPLAALDSARRGMSSQPARDQARADALRHLAQVDAAFVESEAATLTEVEARDDTYRTLISLAIAGGRLKDAMRLANATSAGSTASVSSRFAIARTLAKTGKNDEAVALLRELLPDVRSIPPCSGCVIITNDPPRESGHNRHEIIEILSMALEHDMYAEIKAWAATRETPAARAWAWIETAQAVAFVKLGRYPNVPMHGR